MTREQLFARQREARGLCLVVAQLAFTLSSLQVMLWVTNKTGWGSVARMCFSRKTRVKSKHFISARQFCSVDVLLFQYCQYTSAYTPKPWCHPNACLQPRPQPAIPFTLALYAKASSQLHLPNGLQVNEEGESPTELLPEQTATGVSHLLVTALGVQLFVHGIFRVSCKPAVLFGTRSPNIEHSLPPQPPAIQVTPKVRN